MQPGPVPREAPKARGWGCPRRPPAALLLPGVVGQAAAACPCPAQTPGQPHGCWDPGPTVGQANMGWTEEVLCQTLASCCSGRADPPTAVADKMLAGTQEAIARRKQNCNRANHTKPELPAHRKAFTWSNDLVTKTC